MLRQEIQLPTEICPACAPFEGASVRPDPAAAALLRPAFERADALCAEVVTEIDQDLTVDGSAESSLGLLVADAMRLAVPGARIAIQNGGGVRHDLRRGRVTGCDVFRVLPFDNVLVEARLSGAEIRRVLRVLSSGEYPLPPVSGIRYRIDIEADRDITEDLDGDHRREPWERNRLVEVTFTDGVPLEADTLYSVVINDFLTAGGDHVSWALQGVGPDRLIEHPELVLRDVVARHLATRGAPANPGSARERPEGVDAR